MRADAHDDDLLGGSWSGAKAEGAGGPFRNCTQIGAERWG